MVAPSWIALLCSPRGATQSLALLSVAALMFWLSGGGSDPLVAGGGGVGMDDEGAASKGPRVYAPVAFHAGHGEGVPEGQKMPIDPTPTMEDWTTDVVDEQQQQREGGGGMNEMGLEADEGEEGKNDGEVGSRNVPRRTTAAAGSPSSICMTTKGPYWGGLSNTVGVSSYTWRARAQHSTP